MTPISLTAAQKFVAVLTNASALQQKLADLGAAVRPALPLITPGQVVLSSAGPDLADRNAQLSYPRVCVYSVGFKNTQLEKFRSISGGVSLVADIWSSADLVDHAELWLHFYIEGITELLMANRGDWGDGFCFAGGYDVQVQPPKGGGLGFVQAARLTFSLHVSRN
jgi:hypothetical protein